MASAAVHSGCNDVVVESADHAAQLLQTASEARRRAATAMNERSSRAHTLLLLTLVQTPMDSRQAVQLDTHLSLRFREPLAGEDVSRRWVARTADGLDSCAWKLALRKRVEASLCIADLGGCERLKKSRVAGERLLEATHINKGLLALKRVITALNQRRRHVPFGDNQLTTLLRMSLGGGKRRGGRALMIIAARPEAEHADEMLNALRFGRACAKVEVASEAEAEGVIETAAIEALDAQIRAVQAKIRAKEVWETKVVVRRDWRSTHLAANRACGGPSPAKDATSTGEGSGVSEDIEVVYRTDTDLETLKVSGLTGAEQEYLELEKLLQSRRELLGQ